MKRLIWLSLLLACMSLLPAASVQAISIGFSPVNQTLGLGGMGSVDIVVSDRGGVEIGAFSFDVLFDPAIIAPTSVIFGTGLGDPNDVLETLVLSDLSVAGTASLAELSFLSVVVLQALQTSDSFVLATLNFDAVGVGVSALSFANTDFADGSGNTLDVTANTGSVTVVPEPGSVLLFSSGLAVVVLWRRRAARRVTNVGQI